MINHFTNSFFFQAEDGIRDWSVTGVQTCALPISLLRRRQDDLRAQLGPPQRRERSTWEWTKGRRFIRLSWRGGTGWRVISITLNDRDVMNRIANYVPKPKPRTP